MATNYDLQQTGDQVQQYLNNVPEMTERTKDTTLININAMADSLAVFTLTSAIEALTAYEQANNVTYRKSGIVLSYKTDNNKWESKQFQGNVSDFDDETLWEDFGSGKVKTVSVNGGDAVQPDEHGNIDIEVPTDLKDLNDDDEHRTVTDAEKNAWSGKQPAGDYATRTEVADGLGALAEGLGALADGLAGKQGTINDLETIRSGAGKGATSMQGVKMEGDDDPLTPDENGVVEIPGAITSVIANHELVFQTTNGLSVKGKVGVTTGADGLLHLTLTDEEGNTYSSPIAGLRVVGNALQYSNDGEIWTTVQTFGKLAIKYVQASDPASGDEGDLALVGSTNAYVLKVYVGGSWVSVCDFGTLDLTSDGITIAGENKTLTEKMAEVNLLGNSNSDSDLEITDEGGYVLSRHSGGHFKTKEFDSRNIGNYPSFNTIEDYDTGDIVSYSGVFYKFIVAHEAGDFDASEVEQITIVDKVEELNENVLVNPSVLVKDDAFADLDFGDRNGYVILRVANGHIKTANFDSSNISLDGYAKKKTIKYLAIGNSVNQDPACYIPYLLKKLYGDDIDFEIGVAYHGSYTIKDYVELIITGQQRLETFSYAKNTATLENHKGSSDALTLLSNVMTKTDWDIVTFEMYQTDLAGSGRDEDVSLSADLLQWLKEHTKDGCRFGLVTPATFTDVRNLYVGWQQDILAGNEQNNIEPCALDFLLDYGATKEFLIKAGFTASDLSPLESDRYTHSKEGFPCEALALTAIHALADIARIDDKASNMAEQITQAEHTAANIPEQNGTFTSTTDANWRKCVDAAVNGWKVSKASFNIANNSLRNYTITNNN